jgi:hypothetical protein
MANVINHGLRLVAVLVTTFALAGCVGVLFIAPPKVAQATFPGENGNIAYVGEDGNDDEIYTIDASGGTPFNVTDNTTVDRSPSYSPDGTKLVYSHWDGIGSDSDIYTIDASGGTPFNVTDDKNTGNYVPSYSPDGQKIAYSGYNGQDDQEIYTIDASGGTPFNVTNNFTTDYAPSYSPDGTKIAYMGAGADWEIFTINASGGTPFQLTNNNTLDEDPSWGMAPSGITAPTIDLEGWADSGISDTDNITNIDAPALAGTAPAGSTVELFDGNASIAEVSADEQDGAWSFEAPVLSEGLHRITATATDAEGGTSAPSDALEVRIDLTAPETTIDSGPANSTNGGSATFEFSANENGSTFLGALDEDSYDEVSSPTTYTNLSNGEHTFKVRAEDVAGNTDASAATQSWEVDALKPTATAPVQALKQNVRLGTSLIPIWLEWSATDNPAGSGIALYQLKQSKDGAAYTTVDLPDPTATSIALNLERGSTYRYMVRAQDEAGNWSAWAVGPRFTVAAHQENSTAVSYPSGTWTRSALSGAYGGYVKYARAQGATATLTFTGRNIAWVATKAPSRGTAEVYVDGAKVSTVDLYSATTHTRTLAFSNGWSASNSHTMTIKVLGTPSTRAVVDVDAFVVLR